MKDKATNSIERQWTRLGVLFNCRPATVTPDLERLLIATASAAAENARLFPLAVTWLVEYGNFVAKHRLKRLVASEADEGQRAVLGLIIDSAIEHGAPRDLGFALDACLPVEPARSLFEVHRGSPSFERLAERSASVLSRKWGVLAPAVELKPDAIRPVHWLLSRNVGFADRIVRKGDLRCSILETLARDAGGRIESESALARLCGATRKAVREALDALVLEGRVTRGGEESERGQVVELRQAA